MMVEIYIFIIENFDVQKGILSLICKKRNKLDKLRGKWSTVKGIETNKRTVQNYIKLDSEYWSKTKFLLDKILELGPK